MLLVLIGRCGDTHSFFLPINLIRPCFAAGKLDPIVEQENTKPSQCKCVAGLDIDMRNLIQSAIRAHADLESLITFNLANVQNPRLDITRFELIPTSCMNVSVQKLAAFRSRFPTPDANQEWVPPFKQDQKK